MLTLDTLNVMLAVSEEGLIEEMIIALLASPQLAVFFEKFPRLKAAITDDVPAGVRRCAVGLKMPESRRNSPKR